LGFGEGREVGGKGRELGRFGIRRKERGGRE
jgi:hypothetical protein